MARIAVFGMGYVGCVTAACLSRDGHRVIGVELDPNKVAQINAGEAPISEPGLGELLRAQVAVERLVAVCDVSHAVRGSEMALICVGTPSAEDGTVCSEAVEVVVAQIGEALRDRPGPYIVVIRSTLLPGILEEQLAPALMEASGRELGDDLWLCNNPEFLREATAIRDYDDPPFVLIGSDDAQAAESVGNLYDNLRAERIVTDTRTAALVKYSCNAFHAVKVAFANEVGAVAKSFGADGQRVMELLCRDRKLNVSPAYLRPGFAFGGSCLPKDLRALTRHIEREGLDLRLLKSVLPSNQAQIRRGIQLVERAGQRKIGLVGLSFKAHSDDLRESPLVILAEALLGRGYDLKIYDPFVQVSRLRGRNRAYVEQHLPHLAALFVEEPSDLFRHASLLVLGNDVATGLDCSDFGGKVIDLRTDLGKPSARGTVRPRPLTLRETERMAVGSH